MHNLWLKPNSIIYLSPTISPLSVLYGPLCRPPLLLSLALSSNLTLMLTHFVTPRWLSLSLSLCLSLSPHRLEDKSACRRISLQSPPFPSSTLSLSLSSCLTLSISLPLSPFTHTRTHSIVNKAGEQGTRGEQGNKGPQSRKVRHRTPPPPDTYLCNISPGHSGKFWNKSHLRHPVCVRTACSLLYNHFLSVEASRAVTNSKFLKFS